MTRNDERELDTLPNLPANSNTGEMSDADLESVVGGKEPNRPNRPRPRPR